MMLQIGLTDSNLQRELGGIRNPTLDAFSEKIEGFEQATIYRVSCYGQGC